MLRFLDEQDEEHTEAFIDGYPFGDRLLEGAMFRVRLNDQKFVVDVPEGSPTHTYMAGRRLGIKKWCKEIADSLNREPTDYLESFQTAGGDGLFLEGAERSERSFMPRQIMSMNGEQLRRHLFGDKPEPRNAEETLRLEVFGFTDIDDHQKNLDNAVVYDPPRRIRFETGKEALIERIFLRYDEVNMGHREAMVVTNLDGSEPREPWANFDNPYWVFA